MKFIIESRNTLPCSFNGMAESYAVVEFIESEPKQVAVVPLSWMNDHDNFCKWPQYNQNQLKKSVMAKIQPQANWKSYSIRCLKKTDSYEKARNLAKKSEDTSDLCTTEEEVANSRARKRNVPIRFRKSTDTSSEISSEGEENCPAPCVPAFPKDLPANISLNNGRSRSTCSSRNDERQQVNSGSNLKENLTARPSWIASNQEVNYDGSDDLGPSYTELRPMNNGLESYEDQQYNFQASGNSGADHLQQDVPINGPYNLLNSSNISAQLPRFARLDTESFLCDSLTSEQSERFGRHVGTGRHSRCDSRNGPFIREPLQTLNWTNVRNGGFNCSEGGNGISCSVFQQKVISILETVRQQNHDILAKLATSDNDNLSLQTFQIPEFAGKLPLEDELDLELLEESVKNKENFSYLVRYFSGFGGKDIVRTTNRILGALLMDTLARQYSYRGSRNGKRGFSKLLLNQCVIRAVRIVVKGSSMEQVEDVVKRWLKHANTRITQATKKASTNLESTA